jgi:hypothetical protein
LAARSRIARGAHDRDSFRAALLDVAATERDAWVDRVLGLGELPEDGTDLPKDSVPYLPCSVDALLRFVDRAAVTSSDVVVDIGSGVGRAAAFVHLLTGAAAMGIEVQHQLASASRDLAARLSLARVATIEGDASTLPSFAAIGTVFFFYCPFSGERLARVLDALEPIARTRAIRIGCVDVPLPERSWLASEQDRDLAIHRSIIATGA